MTKDKHQKNINGKNALLIIDAQAKIIKPIKNGNLIVNNIKKLLKAYEILEENIFISEQNPAKLGSTIEELLPSSDYTKIDKMNFSIANEDSLNSKLSFNGIKNLIVCGFETHICIQQSVLDFLKKKYDVFIVADSIGSRNTLDHDIAIKRMVSEGAKISSSESIIFELCKTSSRDEFKSISNIIKNN